MNLMLGFSMCFLFGVANDAETSYFARIKSPVERSVYAPDETIPIHVIVLATDLNGTSAKQPQVTIHFIKPQKQGFVIHQSANATVTRDKDRAERFVIKHDLSRRAPFTPGKYLLRVKCYVGGNVVGAPSRLILIKEKKTEIEN